MVTRKTEAPPDDPAEDQPFTPEQEKRLSELLSQALEKGKPLKAPEAKAEEKVDDSTLTWREIERRQEEATRKAVEQLRAEERATSHAKEHEELKQTVETVRKPRKTSTLYRLFHGDE